MERTATYTFTHEKNNGNGDTFMSAKVYLEGSEKQLETYSDNAHKVAIKFSKRLEGSLEEMRVGDTLTIEVALRRV